MTEQVRLCVMQHAGYTPSYSFPHISAQVPSYDQLVVTGQHGPKASHVGSSTPLLLLRLALCYKVDRTSTAAKTACDIALDWSPL